jgi:hypothetical protein
MPLNVPIPWDGNSIRPLRIDMKFIYLTFIDMITWSGHSPYRPREASLLRRVIPAVVTALELSHARRNTLPPSTLPIIPDRPVRSRSLI